MTMTLKEQLLSKKAAILEISAKHGARNIRIFGSVARGDEGPDSDIDLLIDLDKDRSLLDHAGLLLELMALMNHKVDVVTEKGLHHRHRQRVLSESIPL